MATTEKDFRVKNGLIVAQNATIGGTLDANALQIGGTAVATESYVTTQISNLIDSAPGTLDTLNELAAAINDDPNFFSSIPTATSDLTNDSGYITSASLPTDISQLTDSTNLIPTNVSDLTNDTGFITSASLPTDISQLTDTTNLIPTNVSDLTNDTGFITSSALSGYATETYVDTAVSNLIDSAPGTLDTLNELAAAINDDANVYTTLTNSIATKLSDLVGDTTPQLGGNLDTNNFDIKLKDGDYITLGNSDDVYMWYDPGGNNLNFLKQGGEYRFSGGAVALYYSSQRKLVTDTNGVTVTGNVSATAFYGDGSNLTGISSYADSDVISLLSSYGSNTISTTGTITTTGNMNAGRVGTDEVSAHAIGNNIDLTLRGGTVSNGIHLQFWDGAWVDALSIRQGTHDIVAAYPTSVTDTTAATSTSTGAIVVSGGVGVAGNVHAAQFHGDGSNLTNLPASGDPAGTAVAMAIALG